MNNPDYHEVSPEKEGGLAKAIEQQTAKIPSDVYLWASMSAMVISLGLKLSKQNHTALFVGQWAAPFLLFGIYNKIVKTQGSERDDE
ncbi:hypothetical protein LV84_01769 [Algoriphagus ratkowskyi]|uniref:Uncharacterized protein n=1 Tax=Algoriphagus ratkowskyi TaxID=57028 RepID=A0A2W7RH09_9BACT|nr:hypothetical protein [Algoriphagus ratkowskyi]PZX57640.1 hypothetical protein LV84_01769 [Algoriphagus ratkowskyi]TXD78911.1 hypothetical protein ESW18_05180 [Algoriphagus ratkowskyi]